MSASTLLEKLEGVRSTGPSKWIARCPSHADKSPSLAIRECDDGTTLIHCFAECAPLEILQAVGLGKEPHNLLVTLGYAGWTQGQLEHELLQNSWLSVPASEHILFDLPAEERLPAAMALLGVDYASLSEDVGHA